MARAARRGQHGDVAETLFGRHEAAALLGVEAANGGELAPLEQFVAAYEGAFGVVPDAKDLGDSLGLLVDAGLVEWRDSAIGLSVEGRKLLRRVGAPWQRDRPERLTERLSLLVEDDLAPPGERPTPSEGELAEAISSGGSFSTDAALAAGLRPVLDNPILGVHWPHSPAQPPGRDPPVVPPLESS